MAAKKLSLSEWIDAFFVACEAAVEEMANAKGLADKLQKDVSYVPKFDRDSYHNRKALWTKIRNKLGSFGEGASPVDLGFHGLKRKGDTYIATGNKVDFYLGSDPLPVSFVGEEIPVIINFISFYRALCYKLDPSMFIREALEKEGINKDNFNTHPSSPVGLIKNPFTEEELS